MSKEQTIISYFPSSTKAETAVNTLLSVGLTDVHIKRNSRFGVSSNAERNAPLATAQTLTGLTLYSANNDPQSLSASERVLMGADPSVSGFSAKGYGLSGGHAFTVVAFVPEERVDEAVTILKQNDGEV